VIERKSAQQAAAREVPGVVESESTQQEAVREVPGVVERESAQQAGQRAAAGRREEENDQRHARHKTPGVVECKSVQRAGQCAAAGRREEENDQQRARHETPGVVGCESAQQAAAREKPDVRERESRQRAAARLSKTFKMACKYINGQYIFHQPCGLWNAPCVHSCGYIHLLSSMPGSRQKCCANSCLSSASDNFNKELMMDHDLDKLPHFLTGYHLKSGFFKEVFHIQQFSCHGSYCGVQL
jgi:hypothetical protein